MLSATIVAHAIVAIQNTVNSAPCSGSRIATGRFCLPVKNLRLVPDGLDDKVAVFTELLAAALQILEQVDISGHRVLCVGDGKLGQLVA